MTGFPPPPAAHVPVGESFSVLPQNKPKINEDPKDAMLREYKNEIERLRLMLEQAASGQPLSLAPPLQQDPGDDAQEKRYAERTREVPVEKIVEVVKERVVEVPVTVEVAREKIVEVEVAPKQLIDQKEALESLNRALQDNRDRLGEELQAEKEIREQLERQLQAYMSSILGETQVGCEGEARPGVLRARA
jgi:hypothetical protein